MTDAQRDRFMAKVDRSGGEDACWIWTASRVHGYGQFPIDGQRLAHRVSYMHFVGDIPDGQEIDHLCRVRLCVNPKHLEAVSRLENIRRTIGDRRSLATKAKMSAARARFWQRRKAMAS